MKKEHQKELAKLKQTHQAEIQKILENHQQQREEVDKVWRVKVEEQSRYISILE